MHDKNEYTYLTHHHISKDVWFNVFQIMGK